MTRTPGHSPFLVLAIPLIALLGAGSIPTPLHAQETPGPATAEVAPAPVMTFPPGGVSLDNAVAVTLQHDPDVQLSQAELQRRQGVALQFQGLFDTTLLVNAQYTHRTQEMSESQKDNELRKRAALEDAIAARQIDVEQVGTLRNLLQNLNSAAPGSGPLDELAQISPATAATLRVLDRLIATAPPGQRQQFLDIRSSFLSDSLRQFDNDLSQANEDFNRLTEQRRLLGEAPIDEVFIDASGNLTVSKLFRSGIVFAPFFDSTFQGTNFKNKPRAAELGGKGISDVLQFRAGVNFTLPLLRGRGAQSVAAAERSALLDAQAGELVVGHQAAASVLRTVQAYWNLRGAQEAAAIARQSVEFQSTLSGLTEQIIGAGDLPQVELARARAAEARARAQMEDADRRYHEARVALADAMGVAVSGDPNTLPTAADPFPPATLPVAVTALIDQAIGGRADLQAASRSIEAGAMLVEGAQDDLRSRLDLQVGSWFTALGEGSGPKALDRWVGPSAGVGFDYEKPIGNNQAEGVLMQRQADVSQLRIAERDLERRIRLAIVESVGSLQGVAARVAQAEAAVGFFETTVSAEMQRFRAGDVTLLDTVLTQQQQIEAQLALVLARQELAQRLAQLQFQTGTLVNSPAPSPAVGQ